MTAAVNVTSLGREGEPMTIRHILTHHAVDEAKQARPPLMLAVIRAFEGWTMLSRHGSWGRFAHRVDAEEAALRLAARVRAEGGDVHIVVQSPAGELQPLATVAQTGTAA
jgi:hypothetical protein